MPFCTYCGQSFTRDEHLERHILTHTNVKPFKCFTCHMSFARRDLLHRHYLVHGKNANQEPITDMDGIVPKSAGRTPIACTNCAKTKTKCDKKHPCTRCAERHLQCSARSTRRTAKNKNGDSNTQKTSSRTPSLTSDGSSTSSSKSPSQKSPRYVTDKKAYLKQQQCFQVHQSKIGTDASNTYSNLTTDYNTKQSDENSTISSSHETFAGAFTESSETMNSFNFSDPSFDTFGLGCSSLAPLTPHQQNTQQFHSWMPSSLNALPFSDNRQTSQFSLASLEDYHSAKTSSIDIINLSTISREKLTETLQKLFNDFQRACNKGSRIGVVHSQSIELPPNNVMMEFLQSYLLCFDSFYPWFSNGALDIDENCEHGSSNISCIMVMMMMVQGSTHSTLVENQSFAASIHILCERTISRLLEYNQSLGGVTMLIQAALISVSQNVCSGSRRRTNEGSLLRQKLVQRLPNLMNSWTHDAQTAILGIGQTCNNPKAQNHEYPLEEYWRIWKTQEVQSRTIYSLVMIDQEIGLLSDTDALISVQDLRLSMPDSGSLSSATNLQDWELAYNTIHVFRDGSNPIITCSRPVSLLEAWNQFLDRKIPVESIDLSPFQLRLLLQPLQKWVRTTRQEMLPSTDMSFSNGTWDSPTIASTDVINSERLMEARSLLHRWHEVARQVFITDLNQYTDPFCASTMIVYHLIYLNTCCNFATVECIAQDVWSQVSMSNSRSDIFTNAEMALHHCGQIIHYIRTMPKDIRPPWWPKALYRVTLMLWLYTMASSNMPSDPMNSFASSDTMVRIDSWSKDARSDLLSNGGVPVLTIPDTPYVVKLEHETTVLRYCMILMEDGVASGCREKVRQKLQCLIGQIEQRQAGLLWQL